MRIGISVGAAIAAMALTGAGGTLERQPFGQRFAEHEAKPKKITKPRKYKGSKSAKKAARAYRGRR